MNAPVAILSDCLDVGSRCIFKGRTGTIIDAPDDGRRGWWVIVLDSGERVAPLEGNPYLKHMGEV